MRLKKFKNLRIRNGRQTSRFVVDLKQEFEAPEAKEIKDSAIELKLEKLAELDYKKYFKAGKDKAKSALFSVKNGLLEIADAALIPPERKPKSAPIVSPWAVPAHRNNKWLELINQIAFVSLAKLIFSILIKLFKLLVKVCYSAGWLAMFLLRLIYLALKSIILPLGQYLKYFFVLFYSLSVKLLKNNAATVLSLAQSLHKTGQADQSAPTQDEAVEEPIVEPAEELINQLDEPEAIDEPESVLSRTGGFFSLLKPAVVFAGVLLILVLPVKAFTYYKTIDSAKGKVLGASESAINNLISGGRAAAGLDFNQADKSFTLASDNFSTAQNQLSEINGWLFTLASVVPNKNIQLAAASKHILRAGELSSAAGKNLSLAVAGLLDFQPKNNAIILKDLNSYGQAAIANITELSGELDQINSGILPEAYQKDFILLKRKIAELNRGLKVFIGIADKAKIFLGDGMMKRYLLVFQNNAELRATGGFIGSFALMDLLNGQIKNIEAPAGGSYDTEAGLLKKIKAPEPLRLVRSDWHFWDANWWPDWPSSARKLAWFYENSDGPTVDGVIGFTPTVMERILKVIGPIDLSESYGAVIDADNFWAVTQEFSEQKPDVTKQPKKIIGDLMNKIIEELPGRLNKSNLFGLLKAVEESLLDKNILFYFTDGELEAMAEELGWDGGVKETAGDYLMVVNTNIAGGKSDRKIKQEIIHRARIQADGSIIDSLTIRRTHEGVKREPFSGVRNVDWLRIYAPLGSKLISASGFKPVDKIFFETAEPDWPDDPDVLKAEAGALIDEASGTKIYNELNKTVFANWSQLDPGETIEINLEYQLPFKLTPEEIDSDQSLIGRLLTKTNSALNPEQKKLYSYSLLAQKQPGMNLSSFLSELKLSDNYLPIWKYPADLTANNGWLFSRDFNQDLMAAIMVEKK